MASLPQIPGVVLEDELGRGAYSIVYRGRRKGTPCAVKVPRVRARWNRWVYREAVALARIHHPGLPRVLEVGHADELPYLVMELVEGETLADRLKRGPLGETETLEVARQLASTLAAVHDAGLVHRDVKPRNIILEPAGMLRLVDFGFASPVERVAESVDTAGTPGFAAPEQLHAPSRVDGRADLYALGRVLEECMTGGRDRSSGTRAALVSGARKAARIVTGLTGAAPEERYPDARALLGEIDRALADRKLWGPGGYTASPQAGTLVGREGELQHLMRAWVAVGSARGSAVVVRGRRGSGKSRLLSAFVATMRESAGRRIIDARCRDGDPPLSLLRRILDAYLESVERGSAEDREAGLRALRAAAAGQLGSFATLIAPKLTRILGETTTVHAALGGFAEGAAEFFLRLARQEGPLAIVVDDAQWADPASRDVLANLAHRALSVPLLLVFAARPEGEGVGRILSTTDAGAAQTLHLAPFGEAQVAALVASQLGVDRVDDAILRRILAMADETPLGTLEVLGAFLDAGALRPAEGSWTLDLERADRVALPEGALTLLGRRVGELPGATRTVLEAAAIVGASFEDAVLAKVVGLEVDDLWFALADCTRAGLLQTEGQAAHRFVHDSLREMLLSSLTTDAQRHLHQRVAEILDEGDAPSFETRCAIATHYAAGEMRSPARAYRAARAAADIALQRFDNETVLRFLGLASAASNAGGIALDVGFYRALGEAHLRLGALEESVRAFEAALAGTHDPKERAALFGRLSWAHSTAADPEGAWSYLDRAFRAIGARMPLETVGSGARTLENIARAKMQNPLRHQAPVGHDEYCKREILCQLHYQNVRLGGEYGRPFRLLQSALESISASEALGPSPGRARALAVYGFVLCALGRRAAGAEKSAAAQTMALEVADPTTEAFCTQLESVAASWAGDFDRALELLRVCVDLYGPWLELNEYSYNVATAELLESLRGRSTEAWAWISKATDRLKRSRAMSTVLPEYIVHRARAALAALGKTADGDVWIAAQVAALTSNSNPKGGFYHLLSWGPRARLFAESGNINASFETLVANFAAEGHNPRFVHPAVSEYYVAVAHVRLHQCLRSKPAERAGQLPALRAAVHDLRTAARLPLLKAHAYYLEGCVAWLDGSAKKAEQLFAKAESLAAQETCPWVLYGVARVRAHALREAGKADAARDQARVAEAIALQHGSEPRLRWIREEFALPVPVAVARPASRSSLSSRRSRTVNFARQQLAALLHVIRAPVTDLRPEQQVPALVDDLVRAVHAERGLLWFEPETEPGPRMWVGRTSLREDWSPGETWHSGLMRDVRTLGQSWPVVGDTAELLPCPVVPSEVDATRVLSVPLFLHERDVGAILLERTATMPPFAPDERELLLVLSYQAPISIELARLLVEREQLHSSLQQAQKMNAVGQLASSVAHDFANMLTSLRGSVSILEKRMLRQPEATAELAVIAGATDRAERLMRRLLGFSQQRPLVAMPSSINDIIVDLVPMLERLVGQPIRVKLDLDPEAELVNLERASFDQVLVNLVLNARDAMPAGGTLTLRTRNVALGEPTSPNGAPRAGDYVLVEVTDTGQGITPENLLRVFDPFFTTKPAGAGIGIGLTTAYGFVKSSHGHIEVTSEVGKWTTFAIYFPKAGALALVGNGGEPGHLPLGGSSAPPPAPLPTRRQADEGQL